VPSTTVPVVVRDAAPAAARAAPAAAPRAARVRTPPTVVAAAVLAVVEALALLAVGLTGLDGVFGTGLRPDGWLVALTLLLLAGWVVLCAGGGASLVDGAGRLLLVTVACGEIALCLVLCAGSVLGVDGLWLVVVGPLGELPMPALALLALAVPATKLLLAGSATASDWLAAGPRPRTRPPALPPRHRLARGVTVGVIGVLLTTFALVSDPDAAAAGPAPAEVDTAR
jgi:hypothetical protein